MAPSNSPGRKRRENEFFRIGEQGRKTGVTLEERNRDEHGFEDLDGVFSSPEKSPPKRTSAAALDKTLTSEDMDIQQSMSELFDSDENANSPINGAYNALVDELLDDGKSDSDTETDSHFAGSMPEPADALSARRSIRPGRNSTFLPPPMGRSPIKTSLGSSPRRQSSMGPPSMRRATKSPDRASSHPAVARILEFSSTDGASDQGDGSASRNKGNARRSIFDIEPTPELEQERTQKDTIADEEESVDEEDAPVNAVEDESLVPVEDGGTFPAVEDEREDNTEEPSELPAAKPRKGAGRTRQGIEKPAQQVVNQAGESDKPARRARGRPKKSNQLASVQASNAPNGLDSRAGRRNRLAATGDVSGISAVENEQEEEEPRLAEVEETAGESPRPQPKKRGRPKASASKTTANNAQDASELFVQNVDEAEVEETAASQSRKRARPKGTGQKNANATKTQQSGAEDEERPSKRTKKDTTTETAAKKHPSQRGGPKAKITAARPANENPQPAVKRAGSMAPPPPQPKSSHTLRATTPFDDGVKTTRSGRASIKPLAKHLGEKVEYTWDRQNVGIIRADANEFPKRKSTGTSKGKKRKRASSTVSDEPELEPDDWETGAGIIAGYVNEWDDQKNISIEDGAQQQDIAYAAGKIQTRDVADTEFRYAKIMGTPYMAAGMVDIPPNGIKRKKNSRRMHIVFCILEGKVTATVGDTQFGITKGGVFVVPRGNFYSLENVEDVEARLFFSQACEVPSGTTQGSEKSQ